MGLKRSLELIGLPVAFVLIAAIIGMTNYLAARHYVRADWTRDRVHSLSQKTKRVLATIHHPVRVTVLMAPPDRYTQSVFRQTKELLRRFQRFAPSLTVDYVDIDTNVSRAAVLAQRYRVPSSDLRDGVIVVSANGRSKKISRTDLAEYEVSAAGRHAVVFEGESQLVSAVLSVTSTDPLRVCFTTGHGEARIDSYEDSGYGYIADEVRRDDYQAEVIDATALMNRIGACRVVVIAGPIRAFISEEIDALGRYLRAGGRVFVLLGPLLDRRVTHYRRIGLEQLLEGWGVDLPQNIVVDPLAVPGEQPLLTWGTRTGYGSHEIARALAGRLTVWPLCREVRPVKPSGDQNIRIDSLIRTSEHGWGETDLESLRGDTSLVFDPAVDSSGPVSVAVAVRRGGSRLVVFGSERGLLNRRIGSDRLRDHNVDLFLAALAWLAGESQLIAVGPKTIPYATIALDSQQLGRVFLLVVVGLPLFAACLGLVVWWRRRR